MEFQSRTTRSSACSASVRQSSSMAGACILPVVGKVPVCLRTDVQLLHGSMLRAKTYCNRWAMLAALGVIVAEASTGISWYDYCATSA